MENTVFWDITPCGFCKKQRVGGKHRLHHQGEQGKTLAVTSNRRKPHGVTFQKTAFFIIIDVETSNLT
jgi:hypothetical protein